VLHKKAIETAGKRPSKKKQGIPSQTWPETHGKLGGRVGKRGGSKLTAVNCVTKSRKRVGGVRPGGGHFL